MKMSPKNFFEHLDLPLPFKDFLIFTAAHDLTRIQKLVEFAGKEKSIQWSLLDLSGSPGTDASCDDLIFC